MKTKRRPILRYHGGKWMLAPWIISHFPPHRIYVEPFAGAASVLLRKPRSYAEILNDIDGEIVNLFRVTRDRGDELARALELTPFARDEYQDAFAETTDPVESARRLVVRSFQGFASDATCRARKSGFRRKSHTSRTAPSKDWRNYPKALRTTIARLRGVVIENRDAHEVLIAHDGPDTLHYCDPPYVHATRSTMMHSRRCYNYEMTDDDHRRLAEILHELTGMVILSGYASALYDELYGHWWSTERPTFADGARPRVESLWINDAAMAQFAPDAPLFAERT